MRRFAAFFALLAMVCCVSIYAGAQPATTSTAAAPNITPPAPTPTAAPAAQRSPVPASSEDPYLWLEDVHGARALAWVRAENAKTLSVLRNDPNFGGFYADALKIAQATDRIPTPEFIRGEIYNFWQDAHHVRGIWRHTSLQNYLTKSPTWKTDLDLDAVAKREKANWVWEGADCAWPAQTRCLIFLSDGGEDAYSAREFDLVSDTFVKNGFALPRGKQNIEWENADTLLVAREWRPGEMTSSGYPFVVKRWRRGQPLSAATEVYRGLPSDVGVSPFALNDGGGHSAIGLARSVTFFTSKYLLLAPGGFRQLNVPPKSEPTALVAGRLLFGLRQDWNVGASHFPSGCLVALDLARTLANPSNPQPSLVFAPGYRETFEAASATASQLVIVAYHNVRGRAFVYTPTRGTGWSKRRLALPDESSIEVVDTDQHSDNAFLEVTSFLTPTTLWYINAAQGTQVATKSLPPRFDASRDVVEQFEATSKDGTKIPYFVVHPKSMQLNGNNPTLLYAYGGFQLSQTPSYSATLGKIWLERGGVYALANIRGGGEFGPAWHDAGLTTHRQRVFDDFAAVAEDLIARKITSPRRLGIEGGSNGGLLMGVEFTQHPELFHAVDIEVPLLDMLRFERIQAGASWTAEYGSVSNPTQRAFLASISPYNNLKAGVAYPKALIWTTTKDDRVGPQHARKFAAKLSSLGVPYFFYEVIEGGHGAGANQQERAFTSALAMTYLVRALMY